MYEHEVIMGFNPFLTSDFHIQDMNFLLICLHTILPLRNKRPL